MFLQRPQISIAAVGKSFSSGGETLGWVSPAQRSAPGETQSVKFTLHLAARFLIHLNLVSYFMGSVVDDLQSNSIDPCQCGVTDG